MYETSWSLEEAQHLNGMFIDTVVSPSSKADCVPGYNATFIHENGITQTNKHCYTTLLTNDTRKQSFKQVAAVESFPLSYISIPRTYVYR